MTTSLEDGFGLIEVMVTTLVLLLVTAGVYGLIDGSQRTTAKNRSRALASGLAEQDQERMRSTRVLDLSNYSDTRQDTTTGVSFTVTSKSEWLRDSTSAPVGCATGSGQAEYMRITSTVAPTNPVQGFEPIAISSLVSPDVGTYGAGQGTLAVEVDGAAGTGKQGILVKVAKVGGGATGQVRTDAGGCAVFNYYPVGSYTITAAEAGYVTTLGDNALTANGVISAGVTSKASTPLYDLASSITATAVTRKTSGGPLVATTFDVPTTGPANALTVANSGISNSTGGRLFFGPPEPIQATSLFPFTAGDAAYSGSCTQNDPTTAAASGDPARTTPAVSLTPGQNTNATIFQPWLQVNVKRTSGGTSVPNAAMYAKAACGTIYRLAAPTNSSAGSLFADSLPFGVYTLCATDGTSQVIASSVNVNKSTDKNTNSDLVVPASGGTAGTCSAF